MSAQSFRRAWLGIGTVITAALIALASSGAASASGKPDPGNPTIHVHPLVISNVCADKGTGLCIQASGGSGNPVTVHPANGQPNQQFSFFTAPGSPCNGGLSTSSCPVPGATPGEQIVVIGGQATQNQGACAAWIFLGSTGGSLTPCNGGSGTVFVLDGFAVESGLLGRQNGGKTYLCASGTSGGVGVFATFATGRCQWSNPAQ